MDWRKGRESNSQGLRSSVFKTGAVANRLAFPWYPRRESNPHLNLRRVVSYPLDYEDVEPPTGVEPVSITYQVIVLTVSTKVAVAFTIKGRARLVEIASFKCVLT